jgi:outer membrane protein assembly factor BamA
MSLLHSRVYLLSLFACSLLFIVPAADAQKTARLIESVDVIGNRRLTDQEILFHIRVREGDKFDNDATESDLKTLLDLGWFDKGQTKVVIEEGWSGVHVRFMVRELPLIADLSIEGLRFVTEGEIIAELREHVPSFQVRMPYDHTKLRTVRASLINTWPCEGSTMRR